MKNNLKIVFPFIMGLLVGLLMNRPPEEPLPQEASPTSAPLKPQPLKECPPSAATSTSSDVDLTQELEECRQELKMLRLSHEGLPEDWSEETLSCCGPAVVANLITEGHIQCPEVPWDEMLLNCDEYPCILTMEVTEETRGTFQGVPDVFKCSPFDGALTSFVRQEKCFEEGCRSVETAFINGSSSGEVEVDQKRMDVRREENVAEFFDTFSGGY